MRYQSRTSCAVLSVILALLSLSVVSVAGQRWAQVQWGVPVDVGGYEVQGGTRAGDVGQQVIHPFGGG